MNKDYVHLIELVKKAKILESANSVLNWDLDVMMPPAQIKYRSQEMGVLAVVVHDFFTDKKIGQLLTKLKKAAGLNAEEKANVRIINRDYLREVKVPAALVQQLEEEICRSIAIWKEAKKTNNFSLFLPSLERIINLKKKYAKAINPKAHPYEVLIGDYEDDFTITEIKKHFTEIKKGIIPLLNSIKQKQKPDSSILKKNIPLDKQKQFNQKIAELIGYDFKKGRLDEAEHPSTDCHGRITTNYKEGWFLAISSTIHETGHAKYDHNLLLKHFGTPLGEAFSMSLHESQSRLWENFVGKSKEFWDFFLPLTQKAYYPALNKPTLEQIYKAINVVEPSFIRIEADELTYDLHIILRFELECALLEGSLLAKDLPAEWNRKMQQYFGITPPTDTEGVLQDTHWACGLIGYFPSYSLGNMLAAQLFAAAEQAIPKLKNKIAAGSFTELNHWLSENIHRYGRRYPTQKLIKKATGKPLSAIDYIHYLENKFGRLYGLNKL